MKLEITYPRIPKRRLQRHQFIKLIRWPVILSAVFCPVVNLIVGGKAWSIVFLMGLYTAWTLILSPALVEYNRISQFIRLIVCSCLLLGLIDLFLAPGWAIDVVPIITLSGLAVSGVLFFTDFERQKQNMMPMLLFIFVSILGFIFSLCFFASAVSWSIIAAGSCATVLLIACILTLGSEFLLELERRFHRK